MGRIASEIFNGESNSSPRVSYQHQKTNQTNGDDGADSFCPETLQIWEKLERSNAAAAGSGNGSNTIIDRRLSRTRTNRKNQVLLEGYAEDDLTRAKSLTDDDLDELKGCLDLGFGGFSYDEIPELCNTLPALELCYSMSQKFLDDTSQKSTPNAAAGSSDSSDHATSDHPSPIANWKISSPGDHPEDVKARLKYWAQAVACTVKLCS